MRGFCSAAILLLIIASCSPAPRGGSSGGGDGDGDDTGFGTGGTDGTTDGGTGDGTECSPPGKKSCKGNNSIQCQLDGTWGAPQECPPGTVCNSFGACQPCAPGSLFCQGINIMECDATGTAATVKESCPVECFSTGTVSVCVDCPPGAKECRAGPDDTSETWECIVLPDQTTEWQKTATCQDGDDCINGLCTNPCSSDVKLNTNQGCDYYAVDLENSTEQSLQGAGTAANAQFAVIISNPGNAAIDVEVLEFQKDLEPLKTVNVPGGGLEIIELGPRNVAGTQQAELAYRIKGSGPFVAYQFNPLDNVNPVFSNDASLLLPVNATGKNYTVMTGSGGGAFVTIVGTKSATSVTVTVTTATDPGPGISGMSAGESQTFTLGAGELLNLKATANPAAGETLTGTTIEASANVIVFAGNVAANMGGRCCADHLEEQMFPTSAWGTTYVAAKAKPRGVELDHWRILAAEDNTNVTFSGGVSNPVTLNAGEFYDLDAQGDFTITGDKPILVGQFLASSFEILELGDYCTSNTDCVSGLCANGGSGGGVCVETCQGSGGTCGPAHYCVENELLGQTDPGGTCIFRPCPNISCPGGTTCAMVQPDSGICLQTCAGFGGQCTNVVETCSPGTEFGDICVNGVCSADWECPGGFCFIPDGEISGECRASCNPVDECGPKSSCIPPGYVSDPTITTGICTSPGCASDADCKGGHTCVIDDQVPDGSCQPIGDPAFILSVPAEQFRDDYVFLAPNAYKEDYVNVIAPADAIVNLDGNPIPDAEFSAVPGSSFKVARMLVADGTHRVTADKPVGVIVYGYHDDVSYGYPGGANLEELNPR